MAYFDLSPDGRVHDSVENDSSHALKLEGSANSSGSRSLAYIGKHWKESLYVPRNTMNALTVYEVEAQECSIRESPVVDWLPRSYNLIPERDQISHRRTRTHVLQVQTNRTPLAPLGIHGRLHFSVLQSRVEVLHLFVTEVGSDGYVETDHWGPLPKGNLLLDRSEARHNAGATERVNAVHTEFGGYAYEV